MTSKFSKFIFSFHNKNQKDDKPQDYKRLQRKDSHNKRVDIQMLEHKFLQHNVDQDPIQNCVIENEAVL